MIHRVRSAGLIVARHAGFVRLLVWIAMVVLGGCQPGGDRSGGGDGY